MHATAKQQAYSLFFCPCIFFKKKYKPGAQEWESEEVFRPSSESQNHSCKEFHGLSAPFRHFRLNLLFSRFWLMTAVYRAGGNHSC